MRRVDQAEPVLVGDPTPGEARFFSPDGEWVAYFSGNALRKVSVRGGPAETIAPMTDNIRGGDWSPDGTIALAGAALATVPPTGGTLTTLATAPTGRRFWYPQIIAGGRAILYTSSFPRPDAGDIEVFDVESKTSRKLLAGVASRLLPTGASSNGSASLMPRTVVLRSHEEGATAERGRNAIVSNAAQFSRSVIPASAPPSM